MSKQPGMFSHNHSHGDESQNYHERIREMEDTISDLKIRIKSLEAALEDVPEEKQADLELELADIRKVLDASKEKLQQLHKKNQQSFIVAAILFFLCFLIYGFYVIWVGV